MVIRHTAALDQASLTREGQVVCSTAGMSSDDLYRRLQPGYPKFFKMDSLCKWTFLAAESLLAGGAVYSALAKDRVGVVLFTAHGCADADSRYLDGIAHPSPSLFVYTLPNIMLGELCIRHGFSGEQLCMIASAASAAELHFTVSGLLDEGNIDACLCGWADVTDDKPDVRLLWVTR